LILLINKYLVEYLSKDFDALDGVISKVTAIEKMIVNSEKYIRALFEGIPFPVYIWQSIENDFILVDYNQIANLKKCDLFKTSLGQKASDLFKNHPDLIELFILCLKKKETVTKELKYRSSKEEDIKT
jgi:hypothetical protein